MRKIKSYNPDAAPTVRKAYEFAKQLHEGQYRQSGEPYIVHPLSVAYILAELGLDDSTICAALLHDIAEDTEVSIQDLAKEFSEEIAEMVDGVTKLGNLKYTSAEEQQVENYRKMFLAMGKDIRVILIKLADRLHNMRTLKYLRRDRQIAISKETSDLYAPLANRLGMYSLKWELEDLAFKYLNPDEYREIVEGINKKREQRLQFINQIVDQINLELKKQKIKAEITGRAKHLYSIYRKMLRDNKSLDQIYDLFALRILVDNVKDCYAALGVVHELYNPMPGRFKDYISVPKPNMYQSLHTTLIGEKGTPFEVQIRTWEMHKVAEEGIGTYADTVSASEGDILDITGLTVVPGLIDTHNHGCVGTEFASENEHFDNGLAYLAKNGITTVVPTIRCLPHERLLKAIDNIKREMERKPQGAKIAGINMEGPFLSPHRIGSMRPENLAKPEKKALREYLAACEGALRSITMAPEVNGVLDLVEEVLFHGANPSIGHTNASYAQAKAMADAGATMVTHLYNARRGGRSTYR